MDDLARFAEEMRVLAYADAVIWCESLKIVQERLAADPELREAVIGHFRREALLWYAAEEDA